MAAAALFGAGAPLSKILLPASGPLLLAGLLYLGAGIGLILLPLVLRSRKGAEAPLAREDVPLLSAIVIVGGIVAPVLLLAGLSRTSGVAGSLLLNLEMPFTVLLAILVFGEHLTRRGWACVACVLVGALLLALVPGETHAEPIGILAVAGACLCWAFDNNLTQRLSRKDPMAITRVKCLAAGASNLGLSHLMGQSIPAPSVLLLSALLGFVSYGLSLVLATFAMRGIGAARFSACFATAPFVGALLAIPLLDERPGVADLAGMLVMAVGVRLLLGERHVHPHVHEEMEHEHLHRHDEHHQHDHLATDSPGEPHSHRHRHERLRHEHPHVSDLHHRHAHGP